MDPFPMTKRDLYDPYHVDDDFEDPEEGEIITQNEIARSKHLHIATLGSPSARNSSPR